MKLLIVSLLTLFTCSFSFTSLDGAGETGQVVKIIDGDTFDLLTQQKKILRIRMNGIDCPERKQDFYQAAKNALADYVFKKEVQLVISGHDRNKRSIATVYCNGQNINLAMIRDGYAWHYKKYSTDTAFAKAELQARKERKGLWSRKDAKAPWEFRKRQEGRKKGPASPDLYEINQKTQ